MFDAFLKLEGVVGESTRAGFEKQLEILSFSFGVSNPTTIGSASGGGGAGRASVSAFNLMKQSDAASPTLFQACASGKHFPKATVTLQKAGGDKAVPYLVYEFENCYIESIQWSGSTGGDDTPTESMSLAFGKVTITHTPQAVQGAVAPKPVVGSWDITTVSK
ncbi:MAG TPA: type VI secretion system tube protein Hcp [Longimicrobiaceae bacterium]|nr:type VI secretion system tube protein Hcp [Longimicrobiaceae bacterium]